jgi:hypothetical protein
MNGRTTEVPELELLPISRSQAASFIQEHHYARKLPSTCKVYLGGFTREGLMAVAVWGYGVRPLHTARKVVMGASTAEYLELNRLCLHDSLPRNSESRFLSLCVKWIEENCLKVEWLFSFADGIYGKPGQSTRRRAGSAWAAPHREICAGRWHDCPSQVPVTRNAPGPGPSWRATIRG